MRTGEMIIRKTPSTDGFISSQVPRLTCGSGNLTRGRKHTIRMIKIIISSMWMRMRTASSRIRGLQAVTRQLPRVKSVKTETCVYHSAVNLGKPRTRGEKSNVMK